MDDNSFDALCPEGPEREEKLARLEEEQDARTGKHARAEPGCSLYTNPYYRNRTHWRPYHEEEKGSA